MIRLPLNAYPDKDRIIAIRIHPGQKSGARRTQFRTLEDMC
jgi:hypothetical protein